MSKITNVGVHIVESASAISDVAGEGQIWVKSDTSAQSGCSLYYTSDIGIENRLSGITLCPELTTTSGASIDVTAIPVGVKRICVMFNGVSLSGTDEFIIQLGTGGSATVSGYLCGMSLISGTSAFTQQVTNGFPWFNDAAALLCQGVMVINLESVASNTWCMMNTSGSQGATTSGSSFGSVSLSGVLDMVRLTSAGGSQTYDAGKAAITFE